MSEPVNLNRVRKAKARADAKAQAAQNRVRYGRSKVEKTIAEAESERATRTLDGARRDD